MTNLNFIVLMNIDDVFEPHTLESLREYKVPYEDIPVDYITVYNPHKYNVLKKTLENGESIYDLAKRKGVFEHDGEPNEFKIDEENGVVTLTWKSKHTALLMHFKYVEQLFEFLERNGELALLAESGFTDKNGKHYQGIVV